MATLAVNCASYICVVFLSVLLLYPNLAGLVGGVCNIVKRMWVNPAKCGTSALCCLLCVWLKSVWKEGLWEILSRKRGFNKEVTCPEYRGKKLYLRLLGSC